MSKITAEQLEQELSHFFGTEEYHKYSPRMFPQMLLTDGASHLAEKAHAYWLMDIISSVAPEKVNKGHDFMVAWLTKKEDGAEFILDDGNWSESQPQQPRNILYKQEIEYTDFPLDKIRLFVSFLNDSSRHILIMLPSEY